MNISYITKVIYTKGSQLYTDMNISYITKVKCSRKNPSVYKWLTCNSKQFCLAMITHSTIEGMKPTHNHKVGIKVHVER